MRRYSLRVPAAEAEPALARMLDLFPDGLEEERDGDDVVLAGYAERPPAEGLAGRRRRARLGGRLARPPPPGHRGPALDRPALGNATQPGPGPGWL